MTTDDRTDRLAASLPDPDALRTLGAEIAATCAGFNLRRASRAVSQHFDHALAPAGLRMTQFTLLSALALGGSATTNELSRSLVIDRTTLTRNLRLLRRAGLVTTKQAQSGRQQRLSLTADGRAALARAFPLWLAAQTSVVEAFDPARWPMLVADLNRVVDGVIGEHTHPVLSACAAPGEPACAGSDGTPDEHSTS